MSKQCGCSCCCSCGPDVRIVTVIEIDPQGQAHDEDFIKLDFPNILVLGSVEPSDVEDVVAWLQSTSGTRIYGERLRQVFDLYDWGFQFSDVPPGTAFRLIVEATGACGCRRRAIKHVVGFAFAAAPQVRISYPGNSPPAVGQSFTTAGWCSDSGATFAATLTRGGAVIANGTSIPQPQGSFYTWQFSFSNVPVSGSPNDTTLTVTATPVGGGVPGSDSRTLSID
jgi:hypothetical protein